ncbi:MAG: DUF2442 domain-containing protein [Oscillospiraceae bacterium]|nr:DUF2442 domain-containing protein [Oscillospiraceae bacterium]
MSGSVEYYLSKGFDRKAAEYFAAGRRQISDVSANDDYTLTILFDNGERRLLDVKALILGGNAFSALSDRETFKRVYLDDSRSISWDIDPNVDSSVVWENKIDLCPDCCYMDSVPVSEN